MASVSATEALGTTRQWFAEALGQRRAPANVTQAISILEDRASETAQPSSTAMVSTAPASTFASATQATFGTATDVPSTWVLLTAQQFLTALEPTRAILWRASVARATTGAQPTALTMLQAAIRIATPYPTASVMFWVTPWPVTAFPVTRGQRVPASSTVQVLRTAQEPTTALDLASVTQGMFGTRQRICAHRMQSTAQTFLMPWAPLPTLLFVVVMQASAGLLLRKSAASTAVTFRTATARM